MAEHYLLDTHSLIWFQENNPQTSDLAMELIQNPENEVLFSRISLYEISIKQKIGKLPAFYASIEEVYQQALNDKFTFVPILNQHIYNYNNVPMLGDHRDLFDRLLIATALRRIQSFYLPIKNLIYTMI